MMRYTRGETDTGMQPLQPLRGHWRLIPVHSRVSGNALDHCPRHFFQGHRTALFRQWSSLPAGHRKAPYGYYMLKIGFFSNFGVDYPLTL